jgi:flavin reductase (DIM6/NTAB) family NADH-FMN oxidoreductase RutF
MQYDVMAKNARLIVGFRQDSHSYQNICATKEFVVNCPTADYLDDMMETARFYPEGVNELEHTRFTMIPSLHVKPPSIKECPQIAECVADEIIPLEKSTGIVIGRIKALVFDEELIDMDREARIRAMNLPIGLGDEDRQIYFHTTLGHITMHRLGEDPGAHLGGEVQLSMPWDADALQMLMTIPPMVRKMVTDQTEQYCQAKGDGKVSRARFVEYSAEQRHELRPPLVGLLRQHRLARLHVELRETEGVEQEAAGHAREAGDGRLGVHAPLRAQRLDGGVGEGLGRVDLFLA